MFRIISIFLVVLTFGLNAQNIDGLLIDAIRYSSDEKVYNTRSAGLGFSYLGIINDQAAIHYNPAGLTLNPKSEISSGFNINMNNVNTDYLGDNTMSDANSYNLTNIGISSPIKSYYNTEDQFYFAISYSNSISYNKNVSTNAFNLNNTYILSESEKNRNWTEKTGLSREYFSFLNDSLNQDYSLSETGGLHELALSMAIEYGENFSFGGTMNISFGTFNYLRYLDESDTRNLYEQERDDPPYEDFDQSFHTLEYDHQFTSINFNFGMLYNANDNLRFSLNFITPSTMRIEEVFYEEAEVIYDDGDISRYDNIGSANTTIYDVLLPWSISLGCSYHIEGLTITGAFQYKDFSQIRFLEPNTDYLSDLNRNVSDQLGGRFKIGLGTEYDIPNTIFQLRGGVEVITSPVDNINESIKVYSCGLGTFLTEAIRLDMFAKWNNSENELFIYDQQSISTIQNKYFIGMGLTYRY